MFAVIFEVHPTPEGMQKYLELAAHMRPHVEKIEGFLSIERWRNLERDGWMLSLSLWRDEAALTRWRTFPAHHCAQAAGRDGIFSDYRLRVGQCISEDARGEPRRVPPRRSAWNDPARPPRFAGIAITEGERPAAGEALRHESILTPGRYLSLARPSPDEAAANAWRDRTLRETSPGRLLLIEIDRDYGMFDRDEAPQYFPPV